VISITFGGAVVAELKLIDIGLSRREERDAFLNAWPQREADPDSTLVAR
jgi:hypothetical protein